MAQVSVPHPKRMVDYALDYARCGIPVFPLIARDKKPLTEHGLKDACTDVAQIEQWWRKWRDANIGMPTGKASGRLAIDIDTKAGATYDMLVVLSPTGKIPATMTAQTPSGGLHLVFRYPRDLEIRNSASKILPGIDVRGEGGYIVVAPSVTATGQYEWTNGLEPAPLPSWLVKLLTEKPEPSPIRKLPVSPIASADDRDAYWLAWALAQAPGHSDDLGFQLAQQLLLDPNVRDIDGTLAAYARQATFDTSKPFTDKDIDRWLKSAQQSNIVRRGEPAKNPRPKAQTARPLPARPRLHAVPTVTEEPAEYGENYSGDEPPTEQKPKEIHNRTDLGNARRFVERHGQNVRHVAAWGSWLIWDGQRWRKDVDGEAIRKAKETARAMWKECADIEDDKDRQDMARHCARSEGESRLKAMLSLAESEPEVAITPERLDANPWLLNVLNGTVDLKTGELLHHDRAHLCSKIAPVEYDALAACPTWLAFLNRIFAGDTDLVSYVQRAVGYALTCEISEQCVFVLHGSGANGKSTFLDTLTRLLGDYGMTTPADTLMWKQNSGIPSDVARLMGARFVSASESADGRRLDEEFVKRISGGDKISARFMHHDWFEFWPVLKLFLAANHKPNIRGTDNGIWRRIQLWPFDVTIPKEEQDRHLAKKLQAEAPGILAWAVRGCLIWQQDGLNPPAKVTGATAEYRSEMDTLGRFIEESCVLRPNAQASAKSLYERYQRWCDENGEKDQGQHRFGRYLGDHGMKRERVRSGIMWAGIGLVDDGE